MEVCDIVQEAVIKTIPMEKKCKKAKWLSKEAFQIAEKRKHEMQTRKDHTGGNQSFQELVCFFIFQVHFYTLSYT